MRRCSLSLLVWGSSLLFTCTAWAQDPELPTVLELSQQCAPEVQENRRAVVEHSGQPGLWFQREVARCLLNRVAVTVPLAERVYLLTQENERKDRRHEFQLEVTSQAEEGEQAAVGAVEAAVRGRREAEEERDAWYNSKGLWVGIGAVVTIILEVVAVWALNQLPSD